MHEAIHDARPTMAFYGGIKQYEPFFEAHGFGDVARRLQAGVQRGDYLSVAPLVPDEMVRAFVAVGVGRRGALAGRVAPDLRRLPLSGAAGVRLPFEKIARYHNAIAHTLYPA